MVHKITILIFFSFSHSVCGQILTELENNLSQKDSLECKQIFMEIKRYDYAFVASELSFIEANHSYKEIKITYYVIGLIEKDERAYRMKIEKYEIDNFKKYNDSDTSERKYKINSDKSDFRKTWGQFVYVDKMGFHKLDNDSLTSHLGI